MGIKRITEEMLYELIKKSNLPPLEHIEAKDQSKIYFRYYGANSHIILVLLHGIGEDSKYLFQLAQYLSNNNIAQVYTPNLRGYGEKVKRRGDVDYIGQLEDDLAHFLKWITSNNPQATIILGGHSFGGASVLRFSSSIYKHFADGYLFIAPYFPKAPFIQKDHSKVSKVNFKLLTVLEKLKIRCFHHVKVYTSYKDEKFLHGGEAIHISFRLAMSRIPVRYKDNINAIQKPSFSIVGDKDELYKTEKFVEVFQHNRNFTTKILPNHNHDGILFSDQTYEEIKAWLANF